MPVQLVADMLIFDRPIVSDLYSLPEWLLNEMREVMMAYNRQTAQRAGTD